MLCQWMRLPTSHASLKQSHNFFVYYLLITHFFAYTISEFRGDNRWSPNHLPVFLNSIYSEHLVILHRFFFFSIHRNVVRKQQIVLAISSNVVYTFLPTYVTQTPFVPRNTAKDTLSIYFVARTIVATTMRAAVF